jgi:hypothetical protein
MAIMSSTKRTTRKTTTKKKSMKSTTTKRKVAAKQRAPRTPTQYHALPVSDQLQWSRVARVIQKVRSQRISVTQAAKEVGISRKKAIQLAGSALTRQSNGRYKAKSFDKLLRVLVIPSKEGLTEVSVKDSRTASTLASYSDAVQRFLRTGDAKKLRTFKSLKITDASGNPIKLLTDTKELTRLGHAGELSFESLYARAA